jgi:hypothetical protein
MALKSTLIYFYLHLWTKIVFFKFIF